MLSQSHLRASTTPGSTGWLLPETGGPGAGCRPLRSYEVRGCGLAASPFLAQDARRDITVTRSKMCPAGCTPPLVVAASGFTRQEG